MFLLLVNLKVAYKKFKGISWRQKIINGFIRIKNIRNAAFRFLTKKYIYNLKRGLEVTCFNIKQIERLEIKIYIDVIKFFINFSF